MHHPTYRLLAAALSGAACLTAQAQTTPSTTSDEVVEMEAYVANSLRDDPNQVLPTEPIDSAFGLSGSVYETPRSITVVSAELMSRYNVQGINDLVAIAPGTFTSSFYGIAGQIEVRGTPGETYFRGMKRIENPGNYPTPIGASDRIDIVRGPPSPIYGPGKVGGYLNFVPKSARAATGKYFDKPQGNVQFTFGSWDKRTMSMRSEAPIGVG